MISLITTAKAQKKLSENSRLQRLNLQLTQRGLADRSGVPLPTLRKFEQKGLISLEGFLKLQMVLVVLKMSSNQFSQILPHSLQSMKCLKPIKNQHAKEEIANEKFSKRSKGWSKFWRQSHASWAFGDK
jgi:transcriptional regulator with XRE-family HTH domain